MWQGDAPLRRLISKAALPGGTPSVLTRQTDPTIPDEGWQEPALVSLGAEMSADSLLLSKAENTALASWSWFESGLYWGMLV